MSDFTHLDKDGKAIMVDVGGKDNTRRTAVARATIHLPPEVVAAVENDKIVTKKGAVFEVARLAGIMAVKKTSELIPLCHPLSINACGVEIEMVSATTIQVDCQVTIDGRTGVEMEALTGASVAALTIYDMCKAMSHDITIQKIALIRKSGGKRDFDRER